VTALSLPLSSEAVPTGTDHRLSAPLAIRRGGRHTDLMVKASHDPRLVQVALIGSFRQHFATILDVRRCCEDRGLSVTTPAGTNVLDDTVAFVRLDCDDTALEDPAVQSVATLRILDADAVYVVAPAGYIGKTTSYEVGRAVQARKPVYFSEAPQDLPVAVPTTHIMTAPDFAAHVTAGLHHWWNPDAPEATPFGTALTMKAGGR